MSLETDLLLDRRRLKRRLFFWRSAAVVAVVLAVFAAIRGPDGWGDGLGVESSHIERLTVSGIITENRKLTETVTKLADRDSVRALIVVIDSPGGSVAGGESLHDAIARVAAKKPVVAVMGGVAASAGYMIAVPTQRIFAREATITGSIGVILQTGEASGLMKTLGVTSEAIISGPLKDQPNFAHPLSEQGRAVLQGLVMDMYDQFVQMVATGRNMEPVRVRELGDGRAYSGRQALRLGLVDAIGGEAAAREWLAEAKGVSAKLPVTDVSVGGLAERALRGDAEGILQGIWKSVFSQGVMLDGALALWQPSRQ